MKNALQDLPATQTMTLKEITDLLKVRHNDAMVIVLKMSENHEFGVVSKIDTVYNDKGQTILTYVLDKRQSIAVSAKLNTPMLMIVIDRWQELERSQLISIDHSEPVIYIEQHQKSNHNVVNHIKYMEGITEIQNKYLSKKYAVKHDITYLTHNISGFNHGVTVSGTEAKSINFKRYRNFTEVDCEIMKETISIKNDSKLFYNLDKWISNLHDVGIDSKGSIYLVSDGVNTKIGATSYNVKKRLNELQTGNAKKLFIIDSYKVENKLTTEKYLHKMFAEKNILGEWFGLSELDIQEIVSKRRDIKRVNSFNFLLPEDTETILRVIQSSQDAYTYIENKMKVRAFNAYKDELFLFMQSIPIKNRISIQKGINLYA